MLILEIIKGILYGIVEGITEWLPISSTGHLILLEEFLSLNVGEGLGSNFREEFWKMFEVVIQLGAILAVIILYFRRLNPFAPSKPRAEKTKTWLLWGKIAVASIPAAIVGIGIDMIIEKLTSKDLDGWLHNAWVVSAMLIVYGVAFILIEKFRPKDSVSKIQSIDDISWKTAIGIGAFQALSIVPGTSRSGSTILGSMLLGLSRPAAAEFSFFMAIPAMVGASAIRIVAYVKFLSDEAVSAPIDAWIVLAVAFVTAFAVSMVAIRFLTDFVRKHSFAPFGWYRIALGVLVLGFFGIRALMA